MKGISAVLATVLIVVITVAIIGMAYGWSTGMFKMVADTSEENVQGVTDNMLKSVVITAATCSSDGFGDVTFSIRASGTKDILGTELTAFIDETLVDPQPTFTTLVSGTSKQYVMSGAVLPPVGGTGTTTHTLKIDAPAGSVNEDVTCIF